MFLHQQQQKQCKTEGEENIIIHQEENHQNRMEKQCDLLP